jgi:hypothetical protein
MGRNIVNLRPNSCSATPLHEKLRHKKTGPGGPYHGSNTLRNRNQYCRSNGCSQASHASLHSQLGNRPGRQPCHRAGNRQLQSAHQSGLPAWGTKQFRRPLTRFSSCHADKLSLHDGPSPEHASKHRHVSRRDFSRASKWAGKQRAWAPDEFSPISHIGALEAGSVRKPPSTSPITLTAAGTSGGTGEKALRPVVPVHPRMMGKPVSWSPSSKAGVSASPRCPRTSRGACFLPRSRSTSSADPICVLFSSKAADPGMDSLGPSRLSRAPGVEPPTGSPVRLGAPWRQDRRELEKSIRPEKCEGPRSQERGLSF